MQIDKDGCVVPFGLPAALLPGLGYVALHHAQLDHAINLTVWHLAGTDANAGTAITSAVFNLSTRLDMLRRLLIVKVTDENDQRKLSIIADRTNELSTLRNRIMHERPYWTNPAKSEAGFFRAENLTTPQIKAQPPVTISPETLDAIGDEMLMLTVWLGMFQSRHPSWSDDARFPWRDRLQPKSPNPEPCPACGRSSRKSRRRASPA